MWVLSCQWCVMGGSGLSIAGKPVHEGGRAERGFAGRRGVDKGRAVFAERMRVARGQLHEQIVRVLPIHERLAVILLAGLKQHRDSRPA